MLHRTGTREIDNRADTIDSRDVIERIDELDGERRDLHDAIEDAEGDAERDAAKRALAEWDESAEGDELRSLQALAKEAEGYAADWHYGETLIRDSYFEDYARDLANDVHGRGVRDAEWPFNHIDWEAAADALKADYTSVDFDGVTYWVRS